MKKKGHSDLDILPDNKNLFSLSWVQLGICAKFAEKSLKAFPRY